MISCSVPPRRRTLRRVEQSLTVVTGAAGGALGSRQGGASGTVEWGHRPEAPQPHEGGIGDAAALLLHATQWLAPVRRISRARADLAAAVSCSLDDLPSLPDLEHRWLARTGRLTAGERPMLEDPADLLTADTDDLSVFCHRALYASDLGGREVPRGIDVDDAEVALAGALDSDDLALTAQVLWLWPMLGLVWRAPAALALSVLEANEPVDLGARAAAAYGVLGAALLEHPVRRAVLPEPRGCVVPPTARGLRWESAPALGDPGRRDGLGPFLLTVSLRRGCEVGDVRAVRSALETARSVGLRGFPAARQASAWERRTSYLAERRETAC